MTGPLADTASSFPRGWPAQGAKSGDRAPVRNSGITGGVWDSGRPAAEPGVRFLTMEGPVEQMNYSHCP